MKIACSYAGSYGLPFEAFIVNVDNTLFSGVELIPDQSPNLFSEINKERILSIKKSLRRANITALLHNVFYDINLVSLVPDIQDFSFSITEKVFRIAQEIEAPSVTVHPGYMFPGWRNDASQADRFWTSAERAMMRLGELGTQYGVRPVIENGSYHVTTASGARPRPLHVGVDPDELERLIDAGRPNIGVCLDFSKVVASQRPMRAYLDRVGRAVEQVQASFIGDHEIQWKELVTFMKEQGRDFWVVLEGPLAKRKEQARWVAADQA